MARSTVRHSAALIGVAGIAVLAGCSSAGDAASTESGSSDSGTSSTTESSSASGAYVAGTYEASGSYMNPQQAVQSVTVSMTLSADGTVDGVEVTGDAHDAQSEQYQSQFISGINDEVVGKSIDELSVDKVAGSSLTSQGFNAAVEEIRTQAQG